MPVRAAEGPNKLFIRQIQSSGGPHYTPGTHTIQTLSSKHLSQVFLSDVRRIHQENILVLLSRSGSHADRFKASSCEWSEREGDNSRTIRNKRNGGAAGPLESRASQKGEKRMTALGIGAYWSNWWLVQIRRRPPWECQTFPITN